MHCSELPREWPQCPLERQGFAFGAEGLADGGQQRPAFAPVDKNHRASEVSLRVMAASKEPNIFLHQFCYLYVLISGRVT